MKVVLVVGRDWRFRALLRAQLREEGYEALGLETLEEAESELASSAPRPAALVFDTGETPPGWEEQLTRVAGRLPVAVLAGTQETFRPPPGARWLKRPVRLQDLVRVVEELAG